MTPLEAYQHNQALSLTDEEQSAMRAEFAAQSQQDCGWVNPQHIVLCPRWIAIPSVRIPQNPQPYYFAIRKETSNENSISIPETSTESC